MKTDDMFDMFETLSDDVQKPSGPVTCLVLTFVNDEARRVHFTEELRQKLLDPKFRKIEGFPIGSDDILAPPWVNAAMGLTASGYSG